MADYAIPKNAAAYILYTGLIDQSNTKLLKANPTIASGDFKVSIDGGAFANLATLPTVTPASGTAVKISLSGTEMTGDNIVVACIDAAGAEWCDQFINIQTSARGVADLAFPATSGRSMVVDASGLVDANAVKVGPTGSGTAQTARDLGASVLLSTGTGTGQLDFTSGVVKANAVQLLGTAWLTPGTAGTPDVNVKLWNALATVALPLIPTVAGRTLDVSAGGEAGLDWANVGSPTTSNALTGTTIATTQKVDVDTIKTNPVVNGGTITFPTGATLASTTNITAGTITTVTTVTNQLTAAAIATGVWTDTTAGDFTTALSVGKSLMNGVTLGTGLTIARCTLTDTLTTYTGNTVQTGDSFARIGSAGAGLTALGDTRIANLDAAVSSRMATYTQPSGFLAATFPGTVASPTNITAGTITTVTTLTNLPAITTDWLSAAGVSAAAVTKIQSGLSTYAGGDTNGTTTLLTRIGGSITISGGKVAATVGATDYSGNTVQTGDSYARLGAPTGASIAADLAEIEAETDGIASLTAAAIWDLATSGHTTAGTFGAAMAAAGGATDPMTNTASSYTSPMLGYIIGQLLSHAITYTGPVNPTTGTMTLTRGDDYLTADSRELSYAVSTTGGNPDLTGATVAASWYLQTVVIGRDTTTATTATMSAACTVAHAGTVNQTVTVEPTAAKTTLLTGAQYRVTFVATLADGSRDTFMRQTCKVIDP